MMQEFLSKMTGRKLDVYCGGSSSLRGELVKIEDGVAHLRDSEGKMCYLAVDKIIVVWEARDDDRHAGFVSTILNTR